MANTFTLKPRVSEKSYQLAENGNTYTFEVPAGVNKHDIARNVATQFAVTVVGVRVAGVPGKVKRSFRKGGRSAIKGQRSDIRKAYVTLKEGDKLPIYSAVEESGKPDKETK